EAGGEEVPGDDAQVGGADLHRVRLAREHLDEPLRTPLTEEREREHQRAAERRRLAKRLAHTLVPACAEILSGDRRYGEGERHHGQEQPLHHAPPDAESRLRRRPEAPDHPLDDGQDHEQHEELAARGQPDVENAPDERRVRPPLLRVEPDVVLRRTKYTHRNTTPTAIDTLLASPAPAAPSG